MVEVATLVAIGSFFAVFHIITAIILFKEMKRRENRMTKNMIKALEKLEWRDETQ